MQKGFAPILVILIFLVIGATVGGILYFQKSNLAQLFSSAATPSPTAGPIKASPTPKPTPDETANWNEFRVENVYQIKYPDEYFELVTGNRTLRKDEIKPGVVILQPKKNTRFTHSIYIVAAKNTNSLSLQKPEELFGQSPFYKFSDEFKEGKEVKKITLDNFEAYQMNNLNVAQAGVLKDIITINNGIIFEIAVEPDLGEKIPDNDLKLIDSIINSFQFLNSPTSQLDETEKARIDMWIQENNLNENGDPKDSIYAGGTPLFDETTGETKDRYEYILQKHPDRPWNK